MKSVLEMTERELAQFRIDHNVKIEDYPTKGRWSILINKMRAGSSCLLGTYKELSLMRAAFLRMKIKTSYRKDGVGFRVWRLS